jgi:diadenosine tetraphosphate (Ap4A) HIT family hydrolase
MGSHPPPDPATTEDVSYRCGDCGFTLWRPLWRFPHTALGLYDDARFPGRCLLALRDHAVHYEELPAPRVAALMQDAARVGSVLRKVVGADRVNYAVLGNTEPHVHVHLIPRLDRIDPVPRRPPWEHPDPVVPLPADELERISRGIIEGLESSTSTG